MTRTLIAEDDTRRVFEVRDDDGKVVGRDIEFKPTPEDSTRRTLEDRLRAGIDDNRAFRALASPTAAQRDAYLKSVARQLTALNRLALGQLDSAAD